MAGVRATPELAWQAQKLRALALTLAKAGDRRAVEVFNEAIGAAQTLHDAKWRASALRDLASLLLQVGRYDQAGRVIQTLEDPLLQVYALSDLAVALAQAGDSQADRVFKAAGEAIQAIPASSDTSFRRIIEETQAEAQARLASSLIQVGQLDQAVTLIGAIKVAGPQAEALLELAVALSRAGDGRAVAFFDLARQAGQNNPTLLAKLAAALARAGSDQAQAVFDQAWAAARAMANDWSQVDALCRLAELLFQMDDNRADLIFGEAEQAARTILDQFRFMAQQRVAAALAQAGRYPQAEALARSIQDYNVAAETRASIAASLAGEGSFCQALAMLGLLPVDAFIQAMAAWAAAG